MNRFLALTAALMLAVWLFVAPGDAWLSAPYFVFVAILVAATFIDFDHMIIPHELTWGGVAAGLFGGAGVEMVHEPRPRFPQAGFPPEVIEPQHEVYFVIADLRHA